MMIDHSHKCCRFGRLALKTALNSTLDQLQVGFDQSIDRQFGPMRRALAGPDEDALAAKPLAELRAYAAEHPQSYAAHLALGRALLNDKALDDAAQVLQRAATLLPMARGDGSPYAKPKPGGSAAGRALRISCHSPI